MSEIHTYIRIYVCIYIRIYVCIHTRLMIRPRFIGSSTNSWRLFSSVIVCWSFFLLLIVRVQVLSKHWIWYSCTVLIRTYIPFCKVEQQRRFSFLCCYRFVVIIVSVSYENVNQKSQTLPGLNLTIRTLWHKKFYHTLLS